MSAEPVHEPGPYDPDDPAKILRILPQEHHAEFRAEYAHAWEAARDPAGFHALRDLLRLWRLTAEAITAPGYAEAFAEVQKAARTGNWEGGVPIEDLVPDWPERQAAYRRGR